MKDFHQFLETKTVDQIIYYLFNQGKLSIEKLNQLAATGYLPKTFFNDIGDDATLDLLKQGLDKNHIPENLKYLLDGLEDVQTVQHAISKILGDPNEKCAMCERPTNLLNGLCADCHKSMEDKSQSYDMDLANQERFPDIDNWR